LLGELKLRILLLSIICLVAVSFGAATAHGVDPEPEFNGKIVGGTDETKIGNIGDRLKVDDTDDVTEDKRRLIDGEAYVLTIEYVMRLNQTIYQSFKTPNNSDYIQLYFKTYSTGRTEIQLWEAPSGVVLGWQWLPKNRNRSSLSTTNVVIKNVISVLPVE
jgi:hypothetical protein